MIYIYVTITLYIFRIHNLLGKHIYWAHIPVAESSNKIMAPTPDDLIGALQELLDLIENFITYLDDHASLVLEHERVIKKAKIELLVMIGASIIFPPLAPFGFLGAAMSLPLTALEKLQARMCADDVRKISKILNRKFEELNEMMDEFDVHFKLTMINLNIDRDTSILLTMANSPVTNFLRNLCPNKEFVKNFQDFLCLIPALYFSFSFFKNTLGATISKLLAQLATKLSNVFTALKTYAVTIALVLASVFVIIELFFQLKDFSQDGEALTIIKKAIRDLKEKRSELIIILEDVKKMRRDATTLTTTIINEINKVRVDAVNRELGGGFTEKEGLLSFEQFVERIGTGNHGSYYEIFHLAQMTGRSIQILDGTNGQELFLLHGKEEITIPALSNLRETWRTWDFGRQNLPPIRLLLTNENGVRHYSPIDENSKVLSIVNHSQYENRCLFDAVAFHLGISSEQLLKKLQKYLLTSKLAQLDYDFQLAEYFPEFLGGAIRKPDKSQETKVARDERTQTADPTVTAQTYSATIRYSNLSNGSAVTEAIRSNIRAMVIVFNSDRNTPLKYDCGHIIARLLGGPGDIEANIVAMLASLNRGPYNRFERDIWYILNSFEGDLYAEMTVTALYRNDSSIPFQFDVCVKFYDWKGKLEPAMTMRESFHNY